MLPGEAHSKQERKEKERMNKEIKEKKTIFQKEARAGFLKIHILLVLSFFSSLPRGNVASSAFSFFIYLWQESLVSVVRPCPKDSGDWKSVDRGQGEGNIEFRVNRKRSKRKPRGWLSGPAKRQRQERKPRCPLCLDRDHNTMSSHRPASSHNEGKNFIYDYLFLRIRVCYIKIDIHTNTEHINIFNCLSNVLTETAETKTTFNDWKECNN